MPRKMNVNQCIEQFIKYYINKNTEKAIVPILRTVKNKEYSQYMNMDTWIDNMDDEITYKSGIEIDTKKYKKYNNYTNIYTDEIIPTFTIKIYKARGLTMEEAEYDLHIAILKWITNCICMFEGIPDIYLKLKKSKRRLKLKIYKPMTDQKYIKI